MRSTKIRRKAILWPPLACVLLGAAYLLQPTIVYGSQEFRTAGPGSANPNVGTQDVDLWTGAVIQGTVRSEDGTPLYGILVKAANGPVKNAATYVYTDDKGIYEFPPLPVGTYQVSVGVAWRKAVQLTASGATQDFNNIELGPGLVNQVTGVSLLEAIPGTDAEKQLLGESCVACHSNTRLFLNAPSVPSGWATVMERMVYRLDSSDWYPPAVLNADHPMHEHYKKLFSPENLKTLTEYLTNNITPDTKYEYADRALVRPTGEAARAVFTEWQLPSIGEGGRVNDVVADSDGILWFIAAGNGVGKLDPRTGESQVWTDPETPGNSRFHDMEMYGDEIWIPTSVADKVVKFDLRTNEFSSYDTGNTGVGWTYPKGDLAGVTTTYPHTGGMDSAGNYWVTTMGGKDSGVVKIHPGSGEVQKIELPATSKWAYTYGLDVDKNDDVWFAEHQTNKISKIDKDGQLTQYTVPTPFNLPRRVRIDSKGRAWFTGSGYPAHISMLDPVTGTITEYEYGIPSGYPYWIRVDKHDKIWFNSSDPGNVVGRFDPDTEKFVLFTYPQVDAHQTNGHIDNRTDPVTVLFSKPGPGFAIFRMYVRPDNTTMKTQQQ